MRWAVVALAATGCLDTPQPASAPGGSGGHTLAAYGKHVCAIDGQGQLWCWGDNASGELAMSQPAMTGAPLGPIGAGWTDISAGLAHTCGILGGVIKCFGDNSHGQAPADTQASVTLPDNAKPVRVFAGSNTSCAISDIAALYCWGDVPGMGGNLPPTALLVGHAVREVAIAYDHMCAIETNNAMSCWGIDDVGQLGDHMMQARDIAQAFTFSDSYSHLAVHDSATCAISLSGALQCWGASYANFNATDTSNTYRDLAMSSGHVCTVDDGHNLYCYGADDNGALGRGMFVGQPGPPSSSILFNVDEVVVGEGFTCASDTQGDVRCWGSNVYGELGNGAIATVMTPTPVANPAEAGSITKVIAGEHHTCALYQDGHVYCWGGNPDGEVKSGQPAAVTKPTLASNGTFDLLSAGAHHTCARAAATSSIECWGFIAPTTATVPGATMLASGGDAACAYTNSEGICWGSLPQVGTLSTPTLEANAGAPGQVSLGPSEVAYAVQGTGNVDVWAFGDPNECIFGASGVTMAMDYVRVNPAAYAQVAVAQGGFHTCALFDDGTLYCWGHNWDGQAASPPSQTMCVQPMTSLEFSPEGWMSLGGFTGPQVIATGGNHSCALGKMGHLFCWGFNGTFAYADAGVGSPDMPTQIGSLQWSQITTGVDHTCGVSGGQLFCWGYNKWGEVGNGQSFTNQPGSPILFQ